MTAIKSKLAKLLELARRGVGGEAENAQRMLDVMMAKHGITIADIDGDEVKPYLISYKPCKITERLLTQIVATVIGKDFRIYKHPRQRYKIMIKATAAQQVEVDMMYEAHLRNFNKELEAFFSAYVHRHELFPADAEKSDDKSNRDKEDIDKVASYFRNMNRITIRKQLRGT